MRLARMSAIGLSAALVTSFFVASPVAARTPRCDGHRATIVGTNRGDRVIGTTERDVIVAKGGGDEIISGPGRDVICANGGRDLAFSGGGNDLLKGGRGNDLLSGQGGNDRHLGGKGRFDFAQYLGGPGVSVDLADGRACCWGFDRLNSIEALGGSDSTDYLDGDGGMNLIYAHKGLDFLDGRGGADVLAGQEHADDLYGGAGRDLASFFSARSPVNANLDTHTARGEGDDFLWDIEGLGGSKHNDRLTGDEDDNGFLAWRGDDRVSAGNGDDYLDGEAGTDELDGGLGIDECHRGENLINNCELPPPDPSMRELSRAARILAHIEHRIATSHRSPR